MYEENSENKKSKVETKYANLQGMVDQLSKHLQKEGAVANLQQDCFTSDGSALLSSTSFMISQVELFEHKNRTYLHLWNWDGSDMLVPIQQAELEDPQIGRITIGEHIVFRMLSRQSCYLAVTLY